MFIALNEQFRPEMGSSDFTLHSAGLVRCFWFGTLNSANKQKITVSKPVAMKPSNRWLPEDPACIGMDLSALVAGLPALAI